jgi:hypothetical protein
MCAAADAVLVESPLICEFVDGCGDGIGVGHGKKRTV